MCVSFTGNPKTHIITCHSPTNVSTDDEINQFYNTLSDFINTIPTHDLIVIAGDLNAHLGKDLCGSNAYYDVTNRNGKLLKEFSSEHSLTIGFPKFEKRKTKKVTWIAPNGQEHQNDHILIKSKWQNSLKNVESYIKPHINSDHRIVTANIKMSFRSNKSKFKSTKYNWAPLQSDPTVKAAFTLSLHNRFSVLANDINTEDELKHHKSYSAMVSSIQHAAAKHLQQRPKTSIGNLLCNNPDYMQAQSNRDKATKSYSLRKTRAAHKALSDCTTELLRVERDIMDNHVNNAIDSIQRCLSSTKSDSAGKAWKLINKVTGRNQKSSNILKGFESTQERENAWVKHYSNLLYNPEDVINTSDINVPNPLPICTDQFSCEEYDEALKQLKDTTGLDGIPTSLFKSVDLCDVLLPILNQIYNTGIAPPEMLITGILPIPKGNTKFSPDNSRGISMLPVITKLLNRLILNRIRPYVDPLLSNNQNGFRPNRGTREHILATRRIIEEVITYHLPLVITFIDFSKAFDSLLRSKLPEVLASYGIPKKLIKAIMSLYTNTRATVLTPEGLTKEFLTNLGILQGDVLAPFIFIIVLDFILKMAIADGSLGMTLHPCTANIPTEIKITDCAFADDIAAFSNSIRDNTRLCQNIADIASQYGLLINMKKTKFMTFNLKDYTNTTVIPAKKGERKPHFMSGNQMCLNGTDIEEVADFKYLGAYIRTTAQDMHVRKGMAWQALNSMTKCWKSNLSRRTKVRLFKATVESVLLYGCETWTMSKALNCVIDGFYTRLLRKVFGISWKSHTTNLELYGDMPKISSIIRERRLRFAGHIHRHDDQLAHDLLFWSPLHGKRHRGRPNLSYKDVLYTDTGMTLDELKLVMMDRKKWKETVKCSSLTGDPP